MGNPVSKGEAGKVREAVLPNRKSSPRNGKEAHKCCSEWSPRKSSTSIYLVWASQRMKHISAEGQGEQCLRPLLVEVIRKALLDSGIC